MIIYHTDCITIYYHQQNQMIEATWYAFASSRDYRAALMYYVEALKRYEAKRWLDDYRKSRVVRPVDQIWTIREWAPLFMEHAISLERLARVKSQDVSAQISFDNMRASVYGGQQPFAFRELEQYGEARAWLLGV